MLIIDAIIEMLEAVFDRPTVPHKYPVEILPRWVWLTISWFGVSGCFKRARGTWGTLATLPFAFVIHYCFGHVALMLFGMAMFVLGTIASSIYVRSTGKQDPGEIVIDEVAATCVLLSFMAANWQCYLAAFILFRIFDVVKPWPVSIADKHIKGGFGVMFDDVLAALYPVAMFAAMSYVKPEWAQEVLAWLQMK